MTEAEIVEKYDELHKRLDKVGAVLEARKTKFEINYPLIQFKTEAIKNEFEIKYPLIQFKTLDEVEIFVRGYEFACEIEGKE